MDKKAKADAKRARREQRKADGGLIDQSPDEYLRAWDDEPGADGEEDSSPTSAANQAATPAQPPASQPL